MIIVKFKIYIDARVWWWLGLSADRNVYTSNQKAFFAKFVSMFSLFKYF